MEDDDEPQLYCPVIRTYCDGEFCEEGFCARAAVDAEEEDDRAQEYDL